MGGSLSTQPPRRTCLGRLSTVAFQIPPADSISNEACLKTRSFEGKSVDVTDARKRNCRPNIWSKAAQGRATCPPSVVRQN